MCSINTRKSIFFSQTSVRIQLNDTKGVKSDRKIGNQRRLRWSQGDLSFFWAFSPCSTLQVTWTQNVSQVTTVAAIRRST